MQFRFLLIHEKEGIPTSIDTAVGMCYNSITGDVLRKAVSKNGLLFSNIGLIKKSEAEE